MGGLAETALVRESVGLLGSTLTGIAPASAATSPIGCSTGGYTRVLATYIPTDLQREAIDGRICNISGPTAYTYEICLDIPDTSTFTIEAQIRSLDGSTRVFLDEDSGLTPSKPAACPSKAAGLFFPGDPGLPYGQTHPGGCAEVFTAVVGVPFWTGR